MGKVFGSRTFELPADHPFENFRMISVDYSNRTTSFLMRDGALHVDKLPPDHADTIVTRLSFYPHESTVEIKASGRTVHLDVGTVRDDVDVPVVYLDQNHWVDFAKYRRAPAMLDPAKTEFFSLLDDLTNGRAVILPVSGGHLVETSKRGGPSRLDLGETLLEGSRGWQFLDPLSLRRAELRAAFGGELLQRSDVITLAPHALLNTSMEMPSIEELHIALRGLQDRLTWASTLAALFLDDKPIGKSIEDLPAKWAQSFAPLAGELRTNSKARARSRLATLFRFIADMQMDLAGAAEESGLDPQQFGVWIQNEADTAFSTLPGIGRLREVLHLRLINADDRWEANDLNDWFYLSFAAGYCDLILGERKMINLLKRITPKVPTGAKLHSKAAEALSDLRALS